MELFSETSLKDDRVQAINNGDLVFHKVRFEDYGVYKCRAFNSIDAVTGKVKLTVLSESICL